VRASSSDARSYRRAHKWRVLAGRRSYLRRALPPPVARDRQRRRYEIVHLVIYLYSVASPNSGDKENEQATGHFNIEGDDQQRKRIVSDIAGSVGVTES
jgi:hypothetical protein